MASLNIFKKIKENLEVVVLCMTPIIVALSICAEGHTRSQTQEYPLIFGALESETYESSSFLHSNDIYIFKVRTNEGLIRFKADRSLGLDRILSEGDSIKIKPQGKLINGTYLLRNKKGILELNNIPNVFYQ